MSAPRIVCAYCGLGPLVGVALKRAGVGVYVCQGGHALVERREWRKRQEDKSLINNAPATPPVP